MHTSWLVEYSLHSACRIAYQSITSNLRVFWRMCYSFPWSIRFLLVYLFIYLYFFLRGIRCQKTKLLSINTSHSKPLHGCYGIRILLIKKNSGVFWTRTIVSLHFNQIVGKTYVQDCIELKQHCRCHLPNFNFSRSWFEQFDAY